MLNLPIEVFIKWAFMKWVLAALTLLFQNRNTFWTLKMLRVPPAGVCSRGSGGRAASLAGSPGALSLFGVTQPVPWLQTPVLVTAVPLCSVTAALLLVARACWCLFVASRISQCFLPVTAPSTSTEGDVSHFLAYERSELSGERRGP